MKDPRQLQGGLRDCNTTTPEIKALPSSRSWDSVAAEVLEEYADLWRRLASLSPTHSWGSTKALAVEPILNSGDSPQICIEAEC